MPKKSDAKLKFPRPSYYENKVFIINQNPLITKKLSYICLRFFSGAINSFETICLDFKWAPANRRWICDFLKLVEIRVNWSGHLNYRKTKRICPLSNQKKCSKHVTWINIPYQVEDCPTLPSLLHWTFKIQLSLRDDHMKLNYTP